MNTIFFIKNVYKKIVLHNLKVIKSFLYIIKNFTGYKKILKLKDVFKECSNYLSLFIQNEGLKKKSMNKINLMTIHAAKGLEFNYIFLIGLEEGILPVINKIEEERRLFYVAITRAKKKLYLTSAKLRKIVKYKKYQKPSRLLIEIPIFLIKKKLLSKYNLNFKNIEKQYVYGIKVEHVRFGIGKVIFFNKISANKTIYIKFNKYGYKYLSLIYTKLRIL